MRRWNPDSEPLIALGEVYDAFSLGRLLHNCMSRHYDPGHRKLQVATRVKAGLLDLYLYQKEAREELKVLTADDTSKAELEEIISRGKDIADFTQNQLRAFEYLCVKDHQRLASERFLVESFLGFRNNAQRDAVKVLLEKLETWAREYKALEQTLYERGRHEE